MSESPSHPDPAAITATGAPGVRLTHHAMACQFGLRIVGVDEGYARGVARAAFDELDRLEQMLSRFVPHSDIARLNALRPGQFERVSLETSECLQIAARVYADTGGAFDIAFRGRPTIADESAGPRPAPLLFDPVNHAVGVQYANVGLDLGGIGKGYALDRMVAILRDWRIPAALADSGQSTVFALGHPPEAAAWTIYLRRPDQDAAPLGSIELTDAALSGSGQLLHGAHIVDPRTGRPVETMRAAWSIAPTAAVADGLSTAFMVLTPAETRAICARQPGVSAILVPATAADLEVLSYGPHKVVLLRAPRDQGIEGSGDRGGGPAD